MMDIIQFFGAIEVLASVLLVLAEVYVFVAFIEGLRFYFQHLNVVNEINAFKAEIDVRHERIREGWGKDEVIQKYLKASVVLEELYSDPSLPEADRRACFRAYNILIGRVVRLDPVLVSPIFNRSHMTLPPN